MIRVLQISDAHFGRERDEVVDALVELHGQLAPELVVLSGDLTQRATDREFLQARRFADRLGGSAVLSIPGNHDIPLFAFWTRVLSPYARYRRRFGSEEGFEHEDDDLLLIGINSARHLNHKDGEVGAQQRARVADRLRRARPGQLRVVALHHPVHAIRPQDEENLVRQGEAAVRAWAEAGVDAILGGHIHLPYISPLSVRYPELERHVWTVQAGTAVSDRTRGGVPNSVNLLIAAGRDECRVQRWDFEAGAQHFRLHSDDRLTLGPIAPDDPPGGAGLEPSRTIVTDHPP